MANYFTENPDIVFHVNQLDLREIVEIAEDGYSYASQYPHAPTDYDDAMANYRWLLHITGEIAGSYIAGRASAVDQEGATLQDGKVSYAAGTRQNLDQLAQAGLRGMILPYRFGGLNVPFTPYPIAIEIASRADTSLMNLFGLQDIADTVNRFGSEAQRQEFLPGFASGEYTGAMVLTEPEAGSDLQAIKLQAYQDDRGQWFLKGVKRFITNGNAEVLVVLARSEAGSRDGRGLSMFVCYGDETVKVRRIENKLGIHGSPTCELQFNDTPAQLVGKRKLGLIKYVLELMYRARVGVAAQALGTSQQAYAEALSYAKARVQFGKPICEIPAVANMLLDMKAEIEANRTLFCQAAHAVDLKEKLEDKVARLKQSRREVAECSARLKRATRRLNLLAPLAKLIVAESANRITYDAIQIHGGPGYMREFSVERLARDARITTIYEGTSQLQVVAALSGVMSDVLADFFVEHEAKDYLEHLVPLVDHLKRMRKLFLECRQCIQDRKDSSYQDAAARDLVELYGRTYIGYLVLDQVAIEPRKAWVAERFIRRAIASAQHGAELIRNGLFSDLARANEFLG
jgi:alkylation response protein AidB-like acyl-CoA dehydrogenase